MASNKKFKLVVFGLSEHERRVLRTICILSINRSRTYVLDNPAASSASDFAIVDSEDPQVLAYWQLYQAANPMVPAVMVGRAPASESTDLRIGRPIIATRLLAMLDRMHVSKESPAFSVPQAHVANPAPPAGLPPVGQQPPADAGMAVRRALVVDDSLPVRKQIKLELQRFTGAVDVDLAEDGERAMELLSTKSYDIVFLDVVLPGMDGYQICKKIKREKRIKDTPVIMLTGKSSPFDRVRGKLAGCDTYLTKPVNQTKFDKVLKTYLRRVEHEHPTGGNIFAQSFPKPAFPGTGMTGT